MKSLNLIKDLYALEKNFKSWDHFCQVANDGMFIRAVDDIAALYAAEQAAFSDPVSPSKTVPFRGISKKTRKNRGPFTIGLSN